MTNQLIDAHISWLRRVTPSEDTVRHRRDVLRRLALALRVPINQATEEQLNEWQAGLDVARTSIGTYTSHVRAYYSWLQATGQRDDNPAVRLPMPRRSRRLPRPIPEKHLRKAFRLAKPVMALWLALAGWCGMRAGEIARLRDDSFIEDSGAMYVRIDGKGDKQRVVPVPPEMEPLVRAVLRPGRLFLRPRGTPATPGYISTEVSSFFDEIGLPEYTLHWCRHRFGTQLLHVCGDVRVVQQLMGHEDLATTALYLEVIPRKAARSVARLGKTLPRPSARPPLAKGA